MRIVIGSDHAGYELTQNIAAHVRDLGHAVIDLGTDNSTTPVDYPDYAEAVGMALLEGRGDRGILILTASALLKQPSLDNFSGRVSDSGEGRWTIAAAIDEGAPAPVLSAALYMGRRPATWH